ncbi:tyrosyl-DNA phosphodiesterase I [Mycena rebaudengoi]|nr:tyrosyl-DNA phosphodiesterase I [Mycena rebaudengoi]
MSANTPYSNWVQTCPKLGRQRCQHMKYMLLFYKSGRLRVVVSTANLLALDWTHLENSVFIQDFSLRSTSTTLGRNPTAARTSKTASGAAKPEERFETLLESVLVATNVAPALAFLNKSRSDIPIKLISELSGRWDWSMVTVELVPSLAGKWEGWKQIKTTGHPHLMRAIENLGLSASKTGKLVIECQGSSIGTYTTQWFNQFYLSASGVSTALKSHLDISEGKRKKLDYPKGVKVMFPTWKTVKSTSGKGATSLFCKRDKWEAKNFPRAHFYDSRSRAGPALMHTKMIIGTITPTKDNANRASDDQPTAAGWMYVGSHNFTFPAWGNLSGSASSPVLNVRPSE